MVSQQQQAIARPDDPRFLEIARRVRQGERLTLEDGLFLDREADLMAMGRLANEVREKRHGNITFYNTNIHLNPTNVCVYRCRFCAFRADLRDEKAYAFTDDQARERILEAQSRGATEIHVVGGLHHQKKFDWYVNLIRVLHETCPEIHIKAWTAVEIAWFSFLTKKPVDWVLSEMKAAGLGSLPGGGAEIFHDEVRPQICEHKADGENWIRIHRAAHQLGLRSNATMLYGHVERAEHRLDHLMRLRSLQDETGGFQTFIPLAFHPDNTKLAHIPKPTARMDLRMVSLARLMLDNFDHIKAYWIMLGEETAQVAQSFGADDLDGTVVHELIYHDAGAKTPEGLTVSKLHRLIQEAGRVPVERDTLYRRVVREGAKWSIESDGKTIGV
ncbi:Radical SAM domain protein [Planctopirus limnophila DSM 3776]|uniref:Aminodeoxyfutalosine synthase n=1 Tax=Planctopirus limnophila (strain ATCC 43296 / DSM 3776 / IFAM 1008 / Mu 290) TaxID=521674 RepID=D5SN23_PLAL2|nr:aminofutalosine synthase MqnE [Planctopirus limnophila]ADG65950.1 Radical SAM domain protein [Planctopirus limnophila DSM 3776]